MSRQVLPILGAVVGGVIGFYAGGPGGAVKGAQLGFAAGSIVGSIVDPLIIQGNKVGDNQLQIAAEGGARAIVFGQGAVSATAVIARGNRQVTKNRDGGGKGSGPQTENESVYWTYAIGLGEALVDGGILRIWQDENLVYDVRTDGQRSDEDNAAFAATFRFYNGSETQMPDPDLQVFLGDQTPYFRGTAYVVFPNADLTNTAERVPIYKFEVTQSPVAAVGPSIFVTNMDGGDGSTSVADISSNDAVSQLYTTGDDRVEVLSRIVDTGGPFGGNCWRAAFQETVSFSNRAVWFPEIPDYALPGDFTIGLWVKHSVYIGSAVNYFICAQDGVLAPYVEPVWGIYFNSGGSGGTPTYRFKSNELVASIGLAQVEAYVGPVGEWNYIEVARSGSTLYMFVNGVLGGTKPDVSGAILAHELSLLGVRSNGYGLPNFWMQTGDYLGPVQIVKGVALHTVDFTRPTGPFPSEVITGYDPETIMLNTIVDSVLGRVGVTADTTELIDDVTGVVIQETMTGADAVNAIVAAYFADPVEVDGQLTFVKRGKPVQRTLTIDDLIEVPDVSSRENAIEYPAKLHFFFQSPVTGYATTKATSTRYSRNIDVFGEGSVTVPVVFPDSDEPANIASKLHKVMWNEAAGDFSWTVGDHCLDLVPTDTVVLSLRGVVNRARITATELDQGKIKLTMRKDRQSAYTADVQSIALPTPTPPQPTSVSKAVLAVLDIPALVDADDGLYYYTAMSGVTSAWRGGQVQRSLDSGSTWAALSEVTTDVTMGRLVATMAAASQHYPDNTNVVQVQLFDASNTLDDLTQAEWLSENGALAVQAADGSWEIMQYRDALDEGSGLYTLSMLQRGRLNTAAVAHAVAALVVVLDTGTERQAAQSSWLSTVLKHRGVSYGASPEAADIVSTTYGGNSQREWPVASFIATQSGTTVAISSIVPRHRFGTEDVPVRSSNWTGYRIICSNGVSTVTTDTTLTSAIVNVASIGTVTSVSIAQINRTTGAGAYLTQGLNGSGGGISAYTSTLTLGGTFAEGINIALSAGPTTLGSHLTDSGDADLDDVATELAGAVNGNTPTTGYSAVATGSDVEITGPLGMNFDLRATITGGTSGSLMWAGFNQSAAYAGPGSAYSANYNVTNFVTGATEPIPAGTTFTLTIQQPIGNVMGVISFTTTLPSSTRYDVYAGLASQPSVNPGGALYSLGYWVGTTTVGSGYSGVITGPVGTPNVYVGVGTSGDFSLGVSINNPGSLPVPSDRYQTVTYTIAGTPTVGEDFTIILDGVDFTFTATTTSTDDIATGLAALVDADSLYTAVATGSNVDVSGVSVPHNYTYYLRIDRAITASISATIPVP